jgi:hypothetical protein
MGFVKEAVIDGVGELAGDFECSGRRHVKLEKNCGKNKRLFHTIPRELNLQDSTDWFHAPQQTRCPSLTKNRRIFLAFDSLARVRCDCSSIKLVNCVLDWADD